MDQDLFQRLALNMLWAVLWEPDKEYFPFVGKRPGKLDRAILNTQYFQNKLQINKTQ